MRPKTVLTSKKIKPSSGKIYFPTNLAAVVTAYLSYAAMDNARMAENSLSRS